MRPTYRRSPHPATGRLSRSSGPTNGGTFFHACERGSRPSQPTGTIGSVLSRDNVKSVDKVVRALSTTRRQGRRSRCREILPQEQVRTTRASRPGGYPVGRRGSSQQGAGQPASKCSGSVQVDLYSLHASAVGHRFLSRRTRLSPPAFVPAAACFAGSERSVSRELSPAVAAVASNGRRSRIEPTTRCGDAGSGASLHGKPPSWKIVAESRPKARRSSRRHRFALPGCRDTCLDLSVTFWVEPSC